MILEWVFWFLWPHICIIEVLEMHQSKCLTLHFECCYDKSTWLHIEAVSHIICSKCYFMELQDLNNQFLSCRIRQIRVRNDSCLIHPDFQNAIKQCYDEYSESNEDHEPFGTGFRHRTSALAWSYSQADITKGNTYPGLLGSYGPGGAIQVSFP